MKNLTLVPYLASAILTVQSQAVSATTLTMGGYTDVLVGTVPDTGAGFGSMAFGSDGTGYILGGFGSSHGDIYSLDGTGSFNLLTSLGSTGLGVAAHGGFVYSTDEGERIVRTEIGTGIQSLFAALPTSGSSANGLEIIDGLDGASFTLVSVQYGGTVTFLNGDTGAVQYSVNLGGGLSNVEQGPDGALYAVNYSTTSVIKFDQTGTLATTSFGTGYDGIAIHGGTGAMYGYGPYAARIDLLDFDTGSAVNFATGVAGDLGHYPGLLEFSNDGTRLYYGERSGGFQISYIEGFDLIEGLPPTSEVPLPAGLGLLLGALGGLGLMRRRKA